jgi:hypothetical protein
MGEAARGEAKAQAPAAALSSGLRGPSLEQGAPGAFAASLQSILSLTATSAGGDNVTRAGEGFAAATSLTTIVTIWALLAERVAATGGYHL